VCVREEKERLDYLQFAYRSVNVDFIRRRLQDIISIPLSLLLSPFDQLFNLDQVTEDCTGCVSAHYNESPLDEVHEKQRIPKYCSKYRIRGPRRNFTYNSKGVYYIKGCDNYIKYKLPNIKPRPKERPGSASHSNSL